mgnify:CR=1 FL=1
MAVGGTGAPRLPSAPPEYDQVQMQTILTDIQATFDLQTRAKAEGYQVSNIVQDRTVNFRAATITGITAANPGVVTATGHGFVNDENVLVYGVLGMVEVNGGIFAVKNKADNTFELGTTNTSGFTAYGSGGIVLGTTLKEVSALVGTLIEDLIDAGVLGR